MAIFYILFLLKLVYCFDYAETVLKYVDHNVNPCDDFYRHACPLNSPAHLSSYMIKNITAQVIKTGKNMAKASRLEIINDLQLINNSTEEERKKIKNLIPSIYKQLCTSGVNVLPFLEQLEQLLNLESVYCDSFCLTHLVKDPDCVRGAVHIENVFKNNEATKNITDKFKEISMNLKNMAYNVLSIEHIMTENVQDGICQINDMIGELQKVAIELIEKTPWAVKNNVTEMISHVTSLLTLEKDYRSFLNDTLETFDEMNQKYKECKEIVKNAMPLQQIIYCLIYTQHFFPKKVERLFDVRNAANAHPSLFIGFVWHYMMQNTKSYAAKIGAPGFTLAHEIAHSIIKSSDFDLITYFSSHNKKCVQNQYNATCNEYKELSCVVDDETFEENGADVLALQMIQTLLKRHYEEKVVEKPSQYSPEQMMFYSVALAFCSGTKTTQFGPNGEKDVHSPHNIRINAMVNHLSFQTAFQCTDDSRIIKSKTETCYIYGEKAPEHRHRLNLNS